MVDWTSVSSAKSSLKEDEDGSSSIVSIILRELGNIFFILFERVIFCCLVAVNSWPIASATFCGRRRNLCAAFKAAAGEIGGVGGSDDDGYWDGPGDCPILLSSSSSSSLLWPSLKFFKSRNLFSISRSFIE